MSQHSKTVINSICCPGLLAVRKAGCHETASLSNFRITILRLFSTD